jgi:hypothetical protein
MFKVASLANLTTEFSDASLSVVDQWLTEMFEEQGAMMRLVKPPQCDANASTLSSENCASICSSPDGRDKGECAPKNECGTINLVSI